MKEGLPKGGLSNGLSTPHEGRLAKGEPSQPYLRPVKVLKAWPRKPGHQSHSPQISKDQKRLEFLVSWSSRPGPSLSPGNFEGLATRARPSVSLPGDKQRPEKAGIPYLRGALGQVLPYLRARAKPSVSLSEISKGQKRPEILISGEL